MQRFLWSLGAVALTVVALVLSAQPPAMVPVADAIEEAASCDELRVVWGTYWLPWTGEHDQGGMPPSTTLIAFQAKGKALGGCDLPPIERRSPMHGGVPMLPPPKP